MKRTVKWGLAAVMLFAMIVAIAPWVQAAPVSLRGLSTNTKPMNVESGSTFYETNTTNTYVLKQYPDGTKAWVISSAGTSTTFYLATLSPSGASAITSTADELNKNAGVTAGTAKASSTAVLGAYRNLDRLGLGALYLGSQNGTLVTSTAAELNKLTGVTSTAAEFNKLTGVTPVPAEFNTLTGVPVSMTTAMVAGNGTCAVQFVFKNTAGAAISRVFSGIAYVSTSVGAHTSAATGIAALTNGSLSELVTGKVIAFTTKSDGTFGVTLTATTGSYYLTFILPGGVIATSSVLTVN